MILNVAYEQLKKIKDAFKDKTKAFYLEDTQLNRFEIMLTIQGFNFYITFSCPLDEKPAKFTKDFPEAIKVLQISP